MKKLIETPELTLCSTVGGVYLNFATAPSTSWVAAALNLNVPRMDKNTARHIALWARLYALENPPEGEVHVLTAKDGQTFRIVRSKSTGRYAVQRISAEGTWCFASDGIAVPNYDTVDEALAAMREEVERIDGEHIWPDQEWVQV